MLATRTTYKATCDNFGRTRSKMEGEGIYILGEQRIKDVNNTLGRPAVLPNPLDSLMVGGGLLVGAVSGVCLIIGLICLIAGETSGAIGYAYLGCGGFLTSVISLTSAFAINEKLAGNSLLEDRSACVRASQHVSYDILFDKNKVEGWPTADQMALIREALGSDSELGADLKPLYDMFFLDTLEFDLQLLEDKDKLGKEVGEKLFAAIRNYALIAHAQALVVLKSHQDRENAEQQAELDRANLKALRLVDRAELDIQGRTAVLNV